MSISEHSSIYDFTVFKNDCTVFKNLQLYSISNHSSVHQVTNSSIFQPHSLVDQRWVSMGDLVNFGPFCQCFRYLLIFQQKSWGCAPCLDRLIVCLYIFVYKHLYIYIIISIYLYIYIYLCIHIYISISADSFSNVSVGGNSFPQIFGIVPLSSSAHGCVW